MREGVHGKPQSGEELLSAAFFRLHTPLNRLSNTFEQLDTRFNRLDTFFELVELGVVLKK